ncbi:DUF565 domain-containing protein [Prochlorothrix hollandica]|uniref:DUF565 domain-containing protein n=1 Tax=Prochlorothrix hollandica PCC 9006 = CALU 1027 TaxID=317619 RepID=A0A0M2PPA9_PROHO|nr:DUF565 domain-containing protein [Prochlorothrix hollandica]KKI98104.1 hypothetical protein PROH_20545 [Prochlorothrix hollandica PCC 9006 = CALU 1027]
MQNTRLNQLLDRGIVQLENWLSNPWRRWSLLLISFLLGFFAGEVVSSVAGQAARWDITYAAVLVVAVELLSRLVYGLPGQARSSRRSFTLELSNNFKVGLTYSLFLEAFKLGS